MEHKPLFSFGVAADVQYADKEDEIKESTAKYYRGSLQKFEECVNTWNGNQLAFTVHLVEFGIGIDVILTGDIIDGNTTTEQTEKELDTILSVFKRIKYPHYHVVGNHCLKLPRDYLLNKLQLNPNNTYYEFSVNEHPQFKFLVLDGTEISTYGWPEDSPNHQQAKAWLESHPFSDQYPNAKNWNSAVSSSQIAWLLQKIAEAKQNQQKVIVFNHYPVLAASAADTHILWNWQELSQVLIDNKDTVVAFLAGHYHPGGYTHQGVHFLTMKGILEAPKDGNCYAVVHVYSDRLEVKGYGTVEDRTLKF